MISFRELGTKLDNLIVSIEYWIRRKHLTSFYYKWNFYFFLPNKVKSRGISEEATNEVLETLLTNKQVYKWQYKKLKEHFEDYYNEEEE